jgi:peptidoglycan/LPS O-acetylase OafA/YrhL
VTEAGPAQLTAHRRSLDALTGIRFCAAAYVIAYHSKVSPKLSRHGLHLVANFMDNGFESVAIFFLLSGFILAYSYTGQITDWSSYRRFWEARFARIWPVYAISLLLISAVSRTLPKPAEMAAALFMVQAWNPLHVAWAGTWNFVCWTLSCEAFFYLLFPFFYSRSEKLETHFQLWLLIGLLGLIVALNLTRNVAGHLDESFLIPWVPLALLRLPEFLAGVTMGNYFSRAMVRTCQDPKTANLAHGGWFTYTGTALGIATLCHAPWRWSSLIVIPGSLFIFGLASENTAISRALSSKWMIFGGGISYSLYLIQISAKEISTWLAACLGYGSIAGLSVIMCVVLLTMSLTLFLGVEQPARNALRKFFAGGKRTMRDKTYRVAR